MTGFMLQVGLGDTQRGASTIRRSCGWHDAVLITLLFNIGAYFFVRRFREEYE
jgi:hypothetical protein